MSETAPLLQVRLGPAYEPNGRVRARYLGRAEWLGFHRVRTAEPAPRDLLVHEQQLEACLARPTEVPA